MYQKILKPIIDFILAFMAFIVLLPVFVFVAIFLAIANMDNPFFTQTRPGKNEKLFTIIKFKTMHDKKDSQGNLLPDSERLTKIGKLVRKTSLDEIPQLLNVLKGDMSLVGPRPLLPEYLPLYTKEQNKRHLVKPGITGWAQVNGRNAISWENKFKYDVWYVENNSFLLDVKIIFKTISKVLKSEGVAADGNSTIGRFKG
ncbi:MAG TPA: sugar transferase [Flavobacteriia bacterium]|nr:sugar transferase [Flavobacteriia bacterium]